MLQTLLGQKKYEKEMSDEQPQLEKEKMDAYCSLVDANEASLGNKILSSLKQNKIILFKNICNKNQVYNLYSVMQKRRTL